ncbi:sugar ABC transporter ATP-binding protein [Collinsella sp. KGMB02528]|uniref:Sugar ABC transporter ATP-binding protein n=1 Tax=Collinsella acetigenes TaxID=2713419 RepID=A0A7X9UAH5_9ACTN|nr:sugar ABC transporter ATP-binding protein [Collinsella acetigenes]NMF54877.1 sugar ABC transporter ATP-binding protein [Collinsella acetigenes]
MELLNMSGIYKAFSGVSVLSGVELHVNVGEIHALLGENGAGKSTLMNILSGSYTADAGTVTFDGADITGSSIKQIEDAGIAFVHQELNLFNDLLAYENIFLGAEETTPWGSLKKRDMANKAAELFERLGVDIDPYALVDDLKPSEKQLLEISRALFRNAKLLILDEPTASLNTDEVEHMFQIVRGLRDKGTSFIFISHKMPEIFDLCDTYTVLRNGKFIANGNIADTTPREVTNLLVGAALSDRDAYEPRELGEEMLRVEHFSGEGFADVTFTARRGQIIGLTGLKGCGSSELMQGLFGIHHPSGGNVEVCGKKLHGGSIHEAMGAGIAMLPADRKENSVIPDMSLLENMYLSEHVLSARSFAINTKRENERFEKYGKLLNIKANSSADNINSLSGGNQQKVFLARWLNTDAQVLLLDNPTQGIDVGAKSEIYHLILDLARKGKTVIINTLEIPELREVADVCYVLYEGRVVKELVHDEINEQTVMLYSTNSAA